MQRRTKGTGLGLPLAKRLAVLLGGEVSARSTVGAGSMFRGDDPPGLRRHDRGRRRSPPPRRRPRRKSVHRAVIIDDDEASRYVLRRRLGDTFSVVEASSGRAGLDATRALVPDVVFLDLRMAEMSGFEVMTAWRRSASLAHIPIIIFTSQVLSDDDRRRLAGARAILDKAQVAEEGEPTLLDALARAGFSNHVEPKG